jgi:hypothetical protein
MKNNKIVFFLTLLLSIATNASSDLVDYQRPGVMKITQKQAELKLKKMIADGNPKVKNKNNVRVIDGGLQKVHGLKRLSVQDQKNFCYRDDYKFTVIQQKVIDQLEISFENRDIDKILSLVEKNTIWSKLEVPLVNARKINTIDFYDVKNSGETQGKTELMSNLNLFFSHFEKIQFVDFKVNKYVAPVHYRQKNSFDFKELDVELSFDIRGTDKNSALRQERGIWNLKLKLVGKVWKIALLTSGIHEILVNSSPSFKDVTKGSGLQGVITYQRLEAIRRGGYAIAMEDFDNDGNVDVYVGSYGPGKLFKGQKDGTFKEVTDSGLKSEKYVKSAVWADFDNDNKKDLLIVKFIPNQEITKQDNFFEYNNSVVLYKNLGNGKFEKKGGLNEDDPTADAMPAAVADFNNDGLLDIYIGYPGSRDFTDYSYVSNDGMKSQGVYLNKGNFEFKTEKMSAYAAWNYEKFSHQQKLFPHSSTAIDFNQDGKMDIVVVDDRGHLSPAYENVGNSKFIQSNASIGIQNYSIGMGAAYGDINNDGLIDLLLSSVTSKAHERLEHSCAINWEQRGDTSGNSLKLFVGMKNGNKKTFTEAGLNFGLKDVGEGLGAVELIDYDNDGYLDIYVTNGLWSGTDKRQDLASVFARSSTYGREQSLREARNKTTQSEVMTVLSNYKGDLAGGKRQDRLSLAGFQRNRLFRNNGNNIFTEVGFLEGVDSIADGYIVSIVDYNNDGRQDMVLRNADPGTIDVHYSPVQLLQNNNSNTNSLRIKLLGSKSNRDAIGTEVTVVNEKGLKQTKQVIGNNGTAQSEMTLHFGLADSKLMKEVYIKWASGTRTVLKDVKPGFIKIEEPENRDSEKIAKK